MADAERIGATDGASVRVWTERGSIEAPAEVTDVSMPGVVSLPHGWGHGAEGAKMTVAAGRPGVNSNLLAGVDVDPLSGNAILNGISVHVERA